MATKSTARASRGRPAKENPINTHLVNGLAVSQELAGCGCTSRPAAGLAAGRRSRGTVARPCRERITPGRPTTIPGRGGAPVQVKSNDYGGGPSAVQGAVQVKSNDCGYLSKKGPGPSGPNFFPIVLYTP